MASTPAGTGIAPRNAPQQRSPKTSTSAARNSGSDSVRQRKSMPATTTTTTTSTAADNKQHQDISSIKQTDTNNSNNNNDIDQIKLDFTTRDDIDLFQCQQAEFGDILTENLKQTESARVGIIEEHVDIGAHISSIDVDIDSEQISPKTTTTTTNHTNDLENQEPMVLVEPIALAGSESRGQASRSSLANQCCSTIDNNEHSITTDTSLEYMENKTRRRRRLDESDEDDTDNNNTKRGDLDNENHHPSSLAITTNEVKMISPDLLISKNSDKPAASGGHQHHHHHHNHRESSGEEFRVVKKMIGESSHLQPTAVQNINCNDNQPTCLTKPAGPAKGQPFGLHQSINIEHLNSPSCNKLIVEQCLNDLIENADVKSTLSVDESEKVIELTPQPPAGELVKQQVLVDIPIKSSELINEHYDLETRPFARGKFAQVKRCTNKETKQCFAAKCIKKRRRLVDIRHEILLEIEALKLSYYTEHIVKLYEVYETPTEMILILEMANGGELQRVIDDEEFIEEQIVQRMVRQILDGLIYLHDNQIAHLDIKPQNLLLTEPFPNGDVKLCDFGISRRITKDCEIREICGTPDYVAPEILRYDPISLATDMWSLGVLTYVMLSGYSPFGSENKQQTFCNITQATLDFPQDIFGKISQEGVDFVKRLIVREPSERLTSRQARQHHWLTTSWCR